MVSRKPADKYIIDNSSLTIQDHIFAVVYKSCQVHDLPAAKPFSKRCGEIPTSTLIPMVVVLVFIVQGTSQHLLCISL